MSAISQIYSARVVRVVAGSWFLTSARFNVNGHAGLWTSAGSAGRIPVSVTSNPLFQVYLEKQGLYVQILYNFRNYPRQSENPRHH